MIRNPIIDGIHFLRSYFSSQPSYLILFITAVCNARCKHCFYWEEISSANFSKELKLEEYEKIAKSLKLIYLSIGGGEPFLRPDLSQVVEMFYRYSGLLYCNIVSNGYHTDRITQSVKEILARCPRLKLKIQLSIDDFEAKHDENRVVKGIYTRCINTLKSLSLEFRKKESRLNLDIATCLTKSNKNHADRLYDKMREEADFDYYQFLYPRGNAEVAEEKEVSPEEFEKMQDYAHRRDIHVNHNPLLAAVNKISKKGILRFLKKDEHPWDCLAGKKFISITEKGVLQPCEVLHQLKPNEDSDLADLKNFNFDVKAALAQQKSKEVVKNIIKSKCRCSFECAANCNVVFSKKEAMRVGMEYLFGGAG